ncbi:MAG: pitrilysin family protein [bacterium]|nr:pitrilysin family protein [bacterium]
MSKRTPAKRATHKHSSESKLIQHTLPNGLRFYAVPEPSTSAVTLLVMYQVGSRYETDKVAGISHFLEHMFFKGTKRRPDARTITRELDSLGAEYNAFTSKDYTGYYIKTAAEHLTKSYDVLADMLLHSTFIPRDVKRERTVILEEMRMYRDNPLMYMGDLFESALFGKNALGREIIGFKDTILGMTSADLKRYYEMFYQPKNMVVAVAGNVKPNTALAMTKKYFASLKPARRLPFFSCSIMHKEPQVALMPKPTEQVQLCVGFPGYSYTHPRLTALEVLHGVLGSGMSSRLFEIIREQMGLAYNVKTGLESYEDFGAFYARAGTDPKKTMQALKHILKEFSRVKRELVSVEELKRAKSFLTGQLALQLEQSDDYAQLVAHQAFFKDKMETLKGIQDRINKVTRAELREAAREVMDPAKLTLALIGPFKDKRPFARVLRTFK